MLEFLDQGLIHYGSKNVLWLALILMLNLKGKATLDTEICHVTSGLLHVRETYLFGYRDYAQQAGIWANQQKSMDFMAELHVTYLLS